MSQGDEEEELWELGNDDQAYLENGRSELDATIRVEKRIENAFRTLLGSRNSDKN